MQAKNSNPSGGDQVDALDEILNIEWAQIHFKENSIPSVLAGPLTAETKAVLKAKLSALLVEAREQGALAHAESLPASGKQADKSVVRELLRLRKLYDRYELEDTAGHDGNALATWSGYKAFRNPISDRIEEITGVRSDQEVAEWLSQRLPQTDNQDKSSKNASSEELEKQREVTG